MGPMKRFVVWAALVVVVGGLGAGAVVLTGSSSGRGHSVAVHKTGLAEGAMAGWTAICSQTLPSCGVTPTSQPLAFPLFHIVPEQVPGCPLGGNFTFAPWVWVHAAAGTPTPPGVEPARYHYPDGQSNDPNGIWVPKDQMLGGAGSDHLTADGHTEPGALPGTDGVTYVQLKITGTACYGGVSTSTLEVHPGSFVLGVDTPTVPQNLRLSAFRVNGQPGLSYQASWSRPIQVPSCSGSYPVGYQVTLEASPDGNSAWTPFHQYFTQATSELRRFPLGPGQLPLGNYPYVRAMVAMTTACHTSGEASLSATVNLAQA